MDLELEPRPYFQIFHSLLLDDASEQEIERSNKAIEWTHNRKSVMLRVFSQPELYLIGKAWEFRADNSYCPTRESIETLIRVNHKPQVLIDLLYEYDRHSMDLKTIDHTQMDFYLNLRIADYEKAHMQRVLEVAKQITIGSIPNPKSTSFKELPPLSGTQDALNYVAEAMQRGILLKEARPEGGALSEHSETFRKNYQKAKEDRLNGKLFLPTGIPAIDGHMGGIRRKELNGILGYTGQRKTAVARTIAYNVAAAGYRVLHIPLESDFAEELAAYNVMHVHAKGSSKISANRYADGNLSRHEEQHILYDVRAEFEEGVGNNLIVRELGNNRTWDSVKMLIELEEARGPLDLIVIDYLTLLGDPDARDDKAQMSHIIQEAKQVALNLGGHGVSILTPIQGNRKGYDDAKDNDGAWETTGISMYSELDKTLDNCFYVFFDDQLPEANQCKVGSCKTRRHKNIPSTFVSMNPLAGMVIDDRSREEVVHVGVPTPGTNGTFFGFMKPK